MATSGKKLVPEEKAQHLEDHVIDIMPSSDGLWKMPHSIVGIIAGYAWDNPLEGPPVFFGFDNTWSKISFIVKYAGPLDQFEYFVTKLIEKEKLINKTRNPNEVEHYTVVDTIFILDNSHGTLMQHLVIRLDLTLRREDGTAIDEGMAERFAKIIGRLLPHRYPDIVKQASTAAPLEDRETKEKRESTNSNKLKKIFNEFRRGNKHIDKAIEGCDLSLALLDNEDKETMKMLLENASKDNTPVLVRIKDNFIMGGDPDGKWQWTSIDINSLAPEQISFLKQLPFDQGIIRRNNEQFKPLINLLKHGHGLIETLKDFVENTECSSINDQGYLINYLPNINRNHLLALAFRLLAQQGNQLPGGYYGTNADRFCFEIIGGELQIGLQPREMQILSNKEGGLYALLYHNKKAERYIDVNASLFRGAGTERVLGINSHFGYLGDWRTPCSTSATLPWWHRGSFVPDSFFKTYYEQLHQPPNFIREFEHTHRASRSCSIL